MDQDQALEYLMDATSTDFMSTCCGDNILDYTFCSDCMEHTGFICTGCEEEVEDIHADHKCKPLTE